MTPELIDQWAIQSGFTGQECLSWWTDLSKFAALVAAHQRELDAKVCQEEAWRLKNIAVKEQSRATNSKAIQAADCAAAIRGTTPEDKKPPTP